MRKEGFFSAQRLAGISVLLALVIVLQAVVGTISIGLVTLNFSLIPIVLGAIIYGATAGAVLGFGCGVVILIQVILAPTGFYAIIWANNPIITILTCVVKTTVAGWVAGMLFKVLQGKNAYVAVFVSSGIVPVINTALFIVGCLCMNGSISIFQGTLTQYTDMNLFVFIIVVLVTFNFFIEFAINLLVAPALHSVYKVVEKRIKK